MGMITEVEREHRALPYSGHGVCRCGYIGYLRGASPTMRVCIECYEFVFNCKAPRRRSA